MSADEVEAQLSALWDDIARIVIDANRRARAKAAALQSGQDIDFPGYPRPRTRGVTEGLE